MLEKRVFGKTGLEVSRLALGGLFISNCAADRKQSCEVIKRAWELGINYIDTAPSYHDSEEVIGECLQKIDADFIISTKIGNFPIKDFRAQDKDFLRGQLERSFKRLQRDRVNVLMIHEPDRMGEFYDWWTDKINYEGAVLDVLKEYRDKNAFDFIGLGGTTVTEMQHLINSGKFDVLLTAFQYSLLYQEAKNTVIADAHNHGMAILAGSALQQGGFAKMHENTLKTAPPRWISDARKKQFLALYELVNDCGIPLPELALRFVLSDDRIHTVLTGARSVEEIELNVAAAEKGALPQNILDEIEKIYQMVPFRPYGEPMGLDMRPSK